MLLPRCYAAPTLFLGVVGLLVVATTTTTTTAAAFVSQGAVTVPHSPPMAPPFLWHPCRILYPVEGSFTFHSTSQPAPPPQRHWRHHQPQLVQLHATPENKEAADTTGASNSTKRRATTSASKKPRTAKSAPSSQSATVNAATPANPATTSSPIKGAVPLTSTRTGPSVAESKVDENSSFSNTNDTATGSNNNNNFKKPDMITAVSLKTDLNKKESERVINAVLDTIKEQVQAGKRVSWPGFGTFLIKERSARKGRNPQTGEELNIPASKSPGFTPAQAWKDVVNK